MKSPRFGYKSVLYLLVLLLAVALCAFSIIREYSRKKTSSLLNMAVSHLDKGNAHMGTMDYDAAVNEFQKALDIYPGWATAQHNLDVALRKGRLIHHLQENPDDDDSRRRLCAELAHRGEFEDARLNAQLISNDVTRRVMLDAIDDAEDRWEAETAKKD